MPAYSGGTYGAGTFDLTDAQLTFKVEMDLSGSAFGTTFAATDVTASAVAGLGFEPVTITWGRQDQYSAINPTTVGGVMQNPDGTFSPGNTSSSHYPHIRRGLRRRVSVGVNSTTVNLSEDYATGLEVVPARDNMAVTRVDGSDILARFGGAASTTDVNAPSIGTTMRSFIAEEIMADVPVCLFMFQEADGATAFADVTRNCQPLKITNKGTGGTITAGQAAPTTFYGGTFININNPTYSSGGTGGSLLTSSIPSSLTNVTLEAWVVMPSTPPHAGNAWAQIIGLGAADDIAMYVTESTGVVSVCGVGTTGSLCDGKLHHIVGVRAGGACTLYIDGVEVNALATGTFASKTTINIGMFDNGLKGLYPFSGSIAYAAIYAHSLTADRVLSHYQAGITAFAGESTSARITRLLSYRTNTGKTLDAGLGTVGVQSIAGRSLQDCLLEVAQIESGAVFVDGTGKLNFRSRSRLFNPTPTVTLDMSVGGVEFGSNWREDTQNVINDVTVTASTIGSEQRFYDSSSISSDGEFSTSYSLPLNADTDALNLAGWIVANGTQQQLVATPLIINLLRLTAAQAQAVLQLKPLDCLQLTNCPTPAPSSTMTFIVQGGRISLAADAVTVTLNLTRLPYPVAVWDSTTWDATGVTWAF